MPVDFSKLPPKRTVPAKSPSRLVWTVVFFVIGLASVFGVLLLWPKDEPTNTPWFWVCVTIFPLGVATFVVLRRYSVYEGRVSDVLEWNKATDRYMDEVFDRASRPLDALAVSYRFSSDPSENKFDGLLDATLKLEPRSLPKADTLPTKVRWFAVPDQDEKGRKHTTDQARQSDVLRWAFGELQDDLKQTIDRLPQALPLSTRLIVSGSALPENIVSGWNECWMKRELPFSSAVLDRTVPGPLWLDTWLDDVGQGRNQEARLLVFVQLNALLDQVPSDGASEVVLALLLVPSDLAKRHRLTPLAHVHRPQALHAAFPADEPIDAVLSHALRWGKSAAAPDIKLIWQSGLDLGSTAVVTKALVKHGITVRPNNLDLMMGHAGIAAPWFAFVCAIKAAVASEQQLVAVKAGSETMFSIVRGPKGGEQSKPDDKLVNDVERGN